MGPRILGIELTMSESTSSNEMLRAENAELRARVESAEKMLRAIIAGEANELGVEGDAARQLFALQELRDAAQLRARGETLAETFKQLVEDSPLGIYTVDADFRIRHISKGALTAFSSVRPLTGRDFSKVVRITWPEPLASEVIAIFRHTLDTGEPYISPGLTAARHDFRLMESYEWETNRVTLDDGRLGVVCYFFDSTRLQEAKATIARHAAELDRALLERTLEVRHAEKAVATSERMAAVGTLAAGLAHDISNLLLPLGMRLDGLRSSKPLRPNHPPPELSEDVKQELLVLSALIDHLRALVRNLSLFSRDPSNEGSEGSVHLGRWYQQVGKLIDASIGPSIFVKWDCPDDLREAAIAPHRLTQAVQNLVHNARDAILAKHPGAEHVLSGSPMGRITVVARLAGDSRNIDLVVTDNGAGMSEEVLKHCREPFYTTKNGPPAVGVDSGGSGLGLSLAHQIIERAGGAMYIESTLGVGTTITLRIPICPPESCRSL